VHWCQGRRQRIREDQLVVVGEDAAAKPTGSGARVPRLDEAGFLRLLAAPGAG